MIEIIYSESEKEKSKDKVIQPKNIRQIGSPRGRHRIYMEDYVYTYLHSPSFKKSGEKQAAVLIGKSHVMQDIRYTYINGAVSCNDFIFHETGVLFDESCWEYIYKELKEYFAGQEIVGWFVEMTGFPMELTPALEAAHRKYFPGREKILLISELIEKEDVFYAYEQGVLQKKEGYYIYYEKNIPMQEYMVSLREREREANGGIEDYLVDAELDLRCRTEIKSGESSDQMGEISADQAEQAIAGQAERISAEEAIRNYRNMLLERKNSPPQKKMNILLYTAASAAMVILCVIGITTMNNYEKMQQVEQALAVISQSAEQKEKSEETSVLVETVPGNVESRTEIKSPAGQETEVISTESTEPSEATESVEQTEPSEPTESAEPAETSEAAESTEQTETSETAESAEPSEPMEYSEQAEQEESSEPKESAEPTDTAAKEEYYEVEQGDTIEIICLKIYQNLDMIEELCEANGITDVDKIYVGQKLVLP